MPSPAHSQPYCLVHSRLNRSAFDAAFLAYRRGREVLVKVCFGEAGFGGELARRKTLSGSPCDSGILAVFPPPILAGKKAGPPSWLDGWLPADVAGTRMGVLVMRWGGGRPLARAMAAMDDLERIHYLLELAGLLQDFERRGISLESIDPRDFWLVEDEIKWVGLAPIAPLNPLQTWSGCVMADFCREFVALLRRPGHVLRGLMRSCLQGKRRKPPTLAEITNALRRRRRALGPRKNLEILMSFLRPLHLSMWAMLVLGASYWMWVRGDETRIGPQRREILQSKAPPLEKTRALRELLGRAGDQPLFERLVEDIAELQLNEGRIASLDEEVPSRPIAVLILPKQRAIIGHAGVYRLGAYRGYISDIRYNGFELSYKGTLKWMHFEHPRLPVYQPHEKRKIIVWNHPDNLDKILRGIAFLKNTPYRGYMDDQGRSLPVEGKVHGVFRVSRIEDFLVSLERHVGQFRLEQGIELSPSDHILPVYHKFPVLITKDKPLREIAEEISAALGYEVRVSPEIREERFTLYVANMTWQRLLDFMNLEWRVAHSENRKYIQIRNAHRVPDQF